MMTTVKVWDVPVRVCHWLLAACVLANLLFTEEGSEVHEWGGYTAFGVVLFRLLWGFVGSPYARFGSFFPTPSRLAEHWRHLRSGKVGQELGHNPFGALMMFALWGVVVGLGTTGWLMGTDAFWGDETVESIHGFLADSLMPLIALHVGSAVLMSYLGKSNLVAAMLTGRKTVPATPQDGQTQKNGL